MLPALKRDTDTYPNRQRLCLTMHSYDSLVMRGLIVDVCFVGDQLYNKFRDELLRRSRNKEDMAVGIIEVDKPNVYGLELSLACFEVRDDGQYRDLYVEGVRILRLVCDDEGLCTDYIRFN